MTSQISDVGQKDRTRISVCIVTLSSLRGNDRALQEARALASSGFAVHAIGVGTKSTREDVDGLIIQRVKVQRRGIRTTRRWRAYVSLWRHASAIGADVYHAHSTIGLMALVAALARWKQASFTPNYNDLIVQATQGQETNYYEQEQLWGSNQLQERELRRIAATLDVIPRSASSVLDVGCGDGRLTNRLTARAGRVVGADISQEALRHVRAETVLASVTDLPFETRAFEGVVTSDMLEHLPDQEYMQALSEIRRIADLWVVIGVPWRQQLARGTRRCAQCGSTFHVNYHQRSYSRRSLKRVLAPEFRLVRLEHSGGEVRRYSPVLLWIRQQIGGVWAVTRKTICPNCGTIQFPGPIKERNAVSHLCDRIDAAFRRCRRTHNSEVIARYERVSNPR